MMITCCPECATSFRVTPEQLKAVQGKVRCGKCQHVFNAIETLIETTVEPSLAPAPLPDLIEPVESPGEPSLFTDPVEIAATDSVATEEPDIQATADTDDTAQEIEPLLHEEPPGKTSLTWVWAVAALFALLLLLLQVLLHYRVELGVMLPDSKPLLRALCKPFDCVLLLPRMGDLISIESSDLRPAPNGQLILTATLKNRAPFAQTYPHLELTLTNTEDQAILRKVLSPENYLAKDFKPDAGFARNGEIAVTLAVVHEQVANAAAAGYRLYLFYP
jgi:predicted Zn finger-like uncharacterized protein